MDGFRPDYQTLAPMHHLRALMARGITYDTAWVGQMESETPTGHATIATGVYPRKHGVVGFGWRDPTNGGFVFWPTDLRQIIAGNLSRLIEQSGVPTISDLIHQRNRNDLVVSVSGEKYYAAATMGTGADFVLYGKDDAKGKFRPVSIGPNPPPPSSHYQSVVGDSAIENQDAFASSLAVQFAKTLRPRALLINLPGADIGGHYYGAMRDPGHMRTVVRGDDWAIGRVVDEYQKLGILNRTIFVVTADHGMASNRHIVPIHPMYNTVRAAGIAQLDQEYRITLGSIWLKQPQQAQSLATTMAAKHFAGIEGALYRNSPSTFAPEPGSTTHMPHSLLQAYLDLADTEAGPTGPDILLPYGEDTTGLTVKGRKLWGTHGGFSWGVQHIPLVIAGPGVRHGISHFPAKLVDVAPTIEQLLGFKVPAGVDGMVLADGLSSKTGAAQAAQSAVQSRRLVDVKALAAHSLQQGGQEKL